MPRFKPQVAQVLAARTGAAPRLPHSRGPRCRSSGSNRPGTPGPASCSPKAPPPRPDTSKLIEAHAGFRTARSVVLHKSSVDPDYESWRATITGLNQVIPSVSRNEGGEARAQAEIQRYSGRWPRWNRTRCRAQVQIGEFELVHSCSGNPTALFGIGLLDAIPDSVIEAAAKAKYPDFPEVAGRVARQKDGRIGRFGWKAQTPTLNDFVLTACAVELGLEVPGHSQGGSPGPRSRRPPSRPARSNWRSTARSSRTPRRSSRTRRSTCPAAGQVRHSLEAYVREPARSRSSWNATNRDVEAGRALFSKVRSAPHATLPSLGHAEGIYSDLLIHDMGQDLGDTGSYTPFVPGSEDPDFVDPADLGHRHLGDGARLRGSTASPTGPADPSGMADPAPCGGVPRFEPVPARRAAPRRSNAPSPRSTGDRGRESRPLAYFLPHAPRREAAHSPGLPEVARRAPNGRGGRASPEPLNVEASSPAPLDLKSGPRAAPTIEDSSDRPEDHGPCDESAVSGGPCS